jgi:hypothetical protein
LRRSNFLVTARCSPSCYYAARVAGVISGAAQGSRVRLKDADGRAWFPSTKAPDFGLNLNPNTAMPVLVDVPRDMVAQHGDQVVVVALWTLT